MQQVVQGRLRLHLHFVGHLTTKQRHLQHLRWPNLVPVTTCPSILQPQAWAALQRSLAFNAIAEAGCQPQEGVSASWLLRITACKTRQIPLTDKLGEHLGIKQRGCKLLTAGVPDQRAGQLRLSFPRLRPPGAIRLHLQGTRLGNTARGSIFMSSSLQAGHGPMAHANASAALHGAFVGL